MAKTKEQTEQTVASTQQVIDLQRLAGKAFMRMPKSEATKILGSTGAQKKFTKKLLKLFSVLDEYDEVREEWQKFYTDFLGWTVDLDDIIIPERPDGENWRLIFIWKGLKLNLVFNKWNFPKWKYTDDLDKAVSQNVRTADDSYAVWIRDGMGPDQEFLGKSTREADPEMKIGITLLERMILEAKYFSETGENLDKKSLTFCSGSRYSVGAVPCVCFDGGRVRVYWNFLDNSDAACGVRRAVSL